MKKIALLALALSPMAAQDFEVGLNVSRQAYRESTIPGSTLKADDKTVVAARFGYALVDMGPALFQLTAGYQPKVETEVAQTGSGTGVMKQGYWSAGAAFNFKAMFAVGVGVEYRSERLQDMSTGGASTTYGRPWARANVGYAFPTPLVKPFVGLEVAAPMSKKDGSSATSNEDVLKSIAPKMQVGIYGGIRF